MSYLLCVICLAAFLAVAVRSPAATIALVLGAWIAAFAIRDPVDLSGTFSSTNVFALDGLAAVMLAVAAVRALMQWRWDAGRVLVAGLVALVAIHIGRGVLEFDLQAGLNNGRTWLYFVAALAYLCTLPHRPGPAVWRVLIAAGIFLAVLAVPYFVADGIHSASGLIEEDGALVNWRPITAHGALIILQAAILMVATRWPGRRASIGLASALGVVILLLQHRTIWVAALAVLALACVWWAIDRPERRRVAIGIGAGALAALAVAVVAAAIAGGAFWDSIKEPVSDQSTVIWRTDGWGELISDNDSPSNVLTGNPSGVGFERVVDAAAIDASAHNLYIDAYVRFGVIGVLLVASLWILLAVRSRLVAAGSGLDPGR